MNICDKDGGAAHVAVSHQLFCAMIESRFTNDNGFSPAGKRSD
jgi:hypothetical protein